MNAMPVTRADWDSVMTLPFKAYMIAVPFVVALCRVVSFVTGQDSPFGDRGYAAIAKEDRSVYSMLTCGYAVCALALLFVGVVVLKGQRSRRSALVFSLVAMAVVVLYLLGSQPAVAR
jgi:hypothetical protein